MILYITVKVGTIRPVEPGGRGGARSAKDKARRAAVRRCRGGQTRHKRGSSEEFQRFLPQNLKPLVHDLTANERRAALLQRVRAKEAAGRTTAWLDAANTVGAIEKLAVRSRIVEKRPQGMQRGPAAGDGGLANERHKSTSGVE